ncbi:MAG: helix-hairpin-helix domain-containing protein [Bacteroidaceae bacterium]|nr:helix-hairpin-helix domain-containing protein [Bacteroidaceae bacterium]
MVIPIWSRRRGLLLLLLLFHAALAAQEATWEDFQDTFFAEREGDDHEEEERLLELHAHPFSLNEATAETLLQLPFIGKAEADSILYYIRRNGPMLSAGELGLVRSLSFDMRRFLPLFVRFDAPSAEAREPSLLSAWRQGKQEVAANVGIPFYLRQGFKAKLNRATGRQTPAAYRGHPLSGTVRYRATYGDRLAVGFTAKNSDGEPFAHDVNRLFDSYSFFLVRHQSGLLNSWAVGDYKVHIGKGLTAGIGFMNSGMALLASRHDHSQGIFPHSGTDEYRFQRGAAFTLRRGSFRLLTFASHRYLDGRLDDGRIYSINTSGYHRTTLERERKNNVQQTLGGLSADAQFRQLHVGFSALFTHYDHPFARGSQAYQQHYPEGADFGNFGLHYAYDRRKVNVGGETALTHDGRLAMLHDARLQLPWHMRLYVQHRYYHPSYHAPLAWAYTSSSAVRGEHGLMLGAFWAPSRQWDLSGYLDGYRRLGPTFRALTSSNGYSLQAQLSFRPGRNALWLFRYRLRSQQESSTRHPLLRYAMKHTLTLQNQSDLGPLSFTTTLSSCVYKPAIGLREYGGLLGERLSATLWGMKVAASFVAFHTDSYAASLYAYQPALRYAYSNSRFYDHGYAFNGSLLRRWGRHVETSLLCSSLHFTNRATIGSADRMISCPTQTDLSLLLRWFF